MTSTKPNDLKPNPKNKLGTTLGIIIGSVFGVLVVLLLTMIVLKKRHIISFRLPIIDSILFKDNNEYVKYHSDSQSTSLSSLKSPVFD